MAKKNIGVVLDLNDDKTLGNVKSFLNSKRFYFRHSDLISVEVYKNDIVSFELVEGKNNLHCEKVTVIDAKNLVHAIDFSDNTGFEKIRREILNVKGKDFFSDFFDSIPKEFFKKYFCLRGELSLQKRIGLCLEIFAESPSSELEEEIFNLLARVDKKIKFSLPPELLIKEKFWDRGEVYSKLTAIENMPDAFSSEKLCEKICELEDKVSPEELTSAWAENFGRKKIYGFIKSFTPKSSKFNDWAKIILANNFSHEIILNRWNELTDENKLAAFEKYFDTLSVEVLAKLEIDLEKKLSSIEILRRILQKETYAEKISELVKTCASQSPKFNDWAKFILANNFSHEIILNRWNELTDENKLAAFERCFDELTIEKISNVEKILPPEEIIQQVGYKETFAEKISAVIECSEKKIMWAEYLLEGVDLFREIKICDDVMIFFMYNAVKNWNHDLSELRELVELLKEKIADIEISSRVNIVYSYICAGFFNLSAKQIDSSAEKSKYLDECDKFTDRANVAFTKIFDDLTQKIEVQANNPDEKFSIPIHEAHVLPPCTNKTCLFCEAVTWKSQNCNYCPRLNCSDESCFCFRINPKCELPFEKWSVVELLDKLNFVPIRDKPKDHKFNREFFMRIGGEFNRLNELLERMKCRECGNYMRSIKKFAKWKKVLNIRELIFGEHFAVFNATTFSCQNKNCSENGKYVYISYCWHCQDIVDSRDASVKIQNYYLCNTCGAGYHDVLGNSRYALLPGTICPSCTKCPKCSGQEFELTKNGKGEFFLKCKRCAYEINAPLTIKSPESPRYKKGECSVCGHKLKWDNDKLVKQMVKRNYKEIPWRITDFAHKQ